MKKKRCTHTYLRTWLPWPSPSLSPSNYLWACGGLGTIVSCLRSTQGNVGLIRTQRPLWLGLTAAPFAWGDGTFISHGGKTSGAECTHEPPRYSHTEGKRFNLSKRDNRLSSLVYFCWFLRKCRHIRHRDWTLGNPNMSWDVTTLTTVQKRGRGKRHRTFVPRMKQVQTHSTAWWTWQTKQNTPGKHRRSQKKTKGAPFNTSMEHSALLGREF